jgi:hypothetical protein
LALAGAFLAGTFLVGAFLAGAFLAGAFVAETLLDLLAGAWVGGFPAQIPAASSPDPIQPAAVLGPVKAKPCGWPRRRGQP